MNRKSKYDYIIGQRFGFVEPIEYIGKSSYKCICHRCSNGTTARAETLLKGKKKSCGCLPPYKDITGQDFGSLHVNKFVDIRHNHAFWECTCAKCGGVKVYEGKRLRNGSASCGCASLNRNDLTGKIFGELVVESFAYTKDKENYWTCKCDCGNTAYVSTNKLISGNTKSCGCKRVKYGVEHPRFKDITGQVFDNLTAMKYVGNSKWLFKCSCGNEKVIALSDVMSGKTHSCGCLRHRGGKDSPRFKDISGTKFGSLIAIEPMGGNNWLFFCTSCGRGKVMNLSNVQAGKCYSCGCMNTGAIGSKNEIELEIL